MLHDAVTFKGKYWWFGWINYIYLSWYLIISDQIYRTDMIWCWFVQLSEFKYKKQNTSISTFSHVCKTCERIRIRVIAKLLLFNGCNMSTVFVDLLPISLQWVYLDNYGSNIQITKQLKWSFSLHVECAPIQRDNYLAICCCDMCHGHFPFISPLALMSHDTMYNHNIFNITRKIYLR